MKTYKSSGIVLGNLWGGGRASYPARELHGKTERELLEKAHSALSDGSLDSGMGYESLIGALLTIEETETRNIGGRVFSHTEYNDIFIGPLTESEKDFLS